MELMNPLEVSANSWICFIKKHCPELIRTFSHWSNDQAIMTRDCSLVAASGQVWPIINALVEMSFFASPTAMQRRQQIMKAKFEKCQKGLKMEHQTLSWLRYVLKGTHVVSVYCAICRKYEANIQHS